MRRIIFVNNCYSLNNLLCLASKLFLAAICGCLLLPVTHAELTATKSNVTHSPVENVGAKKQQKILAGFAQDTMSNDWRKQQAKGDNLECYR